MQTQKKETKELENYIADLPVFPPFYSQPASLGDGSYVKNEENARCHIGCHSNDEKIPTTHQSDEQTQPGRCEEPTATTASSEEVESRAHAHFDDTGSSAVENHHDGGDDQKRQESRVSKRKTRKNRKRKDRLDGRPSQALSAYNFFFRDERRRILSWLGTATGNVSSLSSTMKTSNDAGRASSPCARTTGPENTKDPSQSEAAAVAEVKIVEEVLSYDVDAFDTATEASGKSCSYSDVTILDPDDNSKVEDSVDSLSSHNNNDKAFATNSGEQLPAMMPRGRPRRPNNCKSQSATSLSSHNNNDNNNDDDDDDDGKAVATASGKQQPAKRPRGRPRGPNYRERVIPHRKISFRQLAQIVGRRWKERDPETAAEYDHHAKLDRARYDAEMSEWTRKAAPSSPPSEE